MSNLGGLGIETFTPLLNPPQVASSVPGVLYRSRPCDATERIAFIDTIGL